MAQETPLSVIPLAASDWTDQVLPFQRTASPSELENRVPTPVQAVGVAHETPFRLGVEGARGPGTDCSDHAVPFHRSANGTLVMKPLVELEPAAVQAVGAVHDTLVRSAEVVPAGTGTRWTDQPVPFQRSENGTRKPVCPGCGLS